ncbi:MAG TPA: addiction module antidote protein, HigA family [Lentisphaeria bacterium]|nr:MAG: addiction module antidote protein, HigA family [Lentisphaerae bacterium GWF2_50_93]HCE44548.1 addiction module antidote protein, HigA family [Lentisphaeria bacterium]
MKRLKPIHAGEFLLKEFLEPMGISQNRLARDIKVDPRRINEICLKKRAVTADTALRLSLYFGTSPELWLNFQKGYELDCIRLAEEEDLKVQIKLCPQFAHAFA